MKMKKIICCLLAGTFLFCAATQASAIEEGTRANKLKRGLVNILSSPLEIPVQMKAESKASDESKAPLPISLVGGLFKGIGMMVTRLGAGIIETLTFSVDRPAGYTPILEPEYVWDYNKTK